MKRYSINSYAASFAYLSTLTLVSQSAQQQPTQTMPPMQQQPTQQVIQTTMSQQSRATIGMGRTNSMVNMPSTLPPAFTNAVSNSIRQSMSGPSLSTMVSNTNTAADDLSTEQQQQPQQQQQQQQQVSSSGGQISGVNR